MVSTFSEINSSSVSIDWMTANASPSVWTVASLLNSSALCIRSLILPFPFLLPVPTPSFHAFDISDAVTVYLTVVGNPNDVTDFNCFADIMTAVTTAPRHPQSFLPYRRSPCRRTPSACGIAMILGILGVSFWMSSRRRRCKICFRSSRSHRQSVSVFLSCTFACSFLSSISSQ